MRRLWIGVGVAAVVAVAAVLVVATRSASPRLVAGPIRTSFDHPVVAFGDRVHARAVIVLDEKVAKRARVNLNLAPLEQLGRARVTRVSGSGLVSLTYEVDAVCIFDECVRKSGRTLLHLPAVTVTAPSGDVLASATWPVLDVRGRVAAADLAATEPPLRVDLAPPPLDYRIAPHTLALLLTVLAALFAGVGVGVAGRQLASLRRERAAWAEPLTELERALALAREAESRAAPDRRRALALLERLLRPRDATLAREARDLAWRSPPPDAGALGDLVDDIESKVQR